MNHVSWEEKTNEGKRSHYASVFRIHHAHFGDGDVIGDRESRIEGCFGIRDELNAGRDTYSCSGSSLALICWNFSSEKSGGNSL